jgi:HopA1 effector protein family
MYNDAGGATSNDMSAVPPFIDELDNLEKAVGVAAILQVGNDFVDLNRGQLSNIKTTPFRTQGDQEGHRRSSRRGRRLRAFRQGQCRRHQASRVREREAGPPGHRVPEHRDGYLAGSLPEQHEVGGPLGAARADSVVIYLSDGQRDSVLAKVRAYYDKNKGYFGAYTPKLTVPVDGMPGVALGMEPPGLAVIRSGGQYYAQKMPQSFGFYHAMLIFMALDRTQFTVQGQSDPQRCAAFKGRAEKYFVHAGIDPAIDPPSSPRRRRSSPSRSSIAGFRIARTTTGASRSSSSASASAS